LSFKIILLRRIVALILLAVFLINLEGAWILFLIRQRTITKEIRTSILKNLKEKDLTLIVITTGELNCIRWVKAGSEFIYKGSMFDIVKTEPGKDKTAFYCINDQEEKKLIEEYQKSCEKMDQTLKILRITMNMNYLCTGCSFKVPLPAEAHEYVPNILFYSSRTGDIQSPPPKPIAVS